MANPHPTISDIAISHTESGFPQCLVPSTVKLDALGGQLRLPKSGGVLHDNVVAGICSIKCEPSSHDVAILLPSRWTGQLKLNFGEARNRDILISGVGVIVREGNGNLW
ncbi:hypothetical protein ACFX13_031728 [Malus domestica]